MTASHHTTSTDGARGEALPRGLAVGRLRRLAAAAAILSAVAVLVATRHGPGLLTDSTYYLSAGVSLAAGQGLTSLDGRALTVFAPGLPAVVALGETIGMDSELTARLFNAVMAGLVVWLGHALLRRHVRDHRWVIGWTIFLGISIPLLDVAKWAMTEPAYVAVVLAGVLVLDDVWSGRPRQGWGASLVALSWAGFLFRYAGLALVLTIGVTLLAGPRSVPLSRRLVRSLTVGGAALVVPVGWMARNHAVDGTLLGPRGSSSFGLVDTLRHVFGTFGYWLFPLRPPSTGAQIAGLALAALLAVGFIVLWVCGRRINSVQRSSLWPLGITVVVTLGYLVVAQLTTDIVALDSRLLISVYVPVVVLGASLIERMLELLPAKQRGLTAVAAVLGVLFVVGQAGLFLRDLRTSARDGEGYNAEFWRRSEVLALGANLPQEAEVVTNNPHALWSAAGRAPITFAPVAGGAQTDVMPSSEAEYLAAACRSAYLVWFDSPSLAMYDFSVGQLPTEVVRTEVVQVADGAVYRLSPQILHSAGLESDRFGHGQVTGGQLWVWGTGGPTGW